jgi:Flp pilus assembly pilin Flp
METIMNWYRSLLSGEEGQALTEFILILILIAIVVLLMMTVLGFNINNAYSTVNSSLPHT